MEEFGGKKKESFAGGSFEINHASGRWKMREGGRSKNGDVNVP